MPLQRVVVVLTAFSSFLIWVQIRNKHDELGWAVLTIMIMFELCPCIQRLQCFPPLPALVLRKAGKQPVVGGFSVTYHAAVVCVVTRHYTYAELQYDLAFK
jgi:hypothetical protein